MASNSSRPRTLNAPNLPEMEFKLQVVLESVGQLGETLADHDRPQMTIADKCLWGFALCLLACALFTIIPNSALRLAEDVAKAILPVAAAESHKE